MTGGPGGGKSTFLSLAREEFCPHVAVLPEAATILYSGGFPRTGEPDVIKAVQRSIWFVSRELEDLAARMGYAVILCDRGTVDGVAYWPDGEDDFYRDLATTVAAENARYAKVIHLETPRTGAYNRGNPSRNEEPSLAADLDRRTAEVWRHHPDRAQVGSAEHFMDKAAAAFAIIRDSLPACCGGDRG